MTERMIVDVPKHPFILRDELGEIVQKPISFIPRINSKNEIERFIENQKEKQFSEMGQKHDQSKPRFSLLPQAPLWQVVVLEFGAGKYGADNWQAVDNARERYFNACHRHLSAWWTGETVDGESGLPHLAHAVCCLLFLMWFDGVDE